MTLDEARQLIATERAERAARCRDRVLAILQEEHCEIVSVPVQIPLPDGSYQAVTLPAQFIAHDAPATGGQPAPNEAKPREPDAA